MATLACRAMTYPSMGSSVETTVNTSACVSLGFWRCARSSVGRRVRLHARWLQWCISGETVPQCVTIWPTGIVEIETRNRHHMATRWVETLKGKKHLRLVSGDPGRAPTHEA
jgi:hypothetical protein